MARGNLAKNVKYGRIKKGGSPKRGGKALAAGWTGTPTKPTTSWVDLRRIYPRGKAPAATPKPPATGNAGLKTIKGLSTGRNFRAIDRGPDFEGLRRAAKKAITKGSKK